MPRIYSQQEEKERTKQLKTDIREIFSESSKSFCLTSLIVKLEKKGKRCPREDTQRVLEFLENKKEIVQYDRFPPNASNGRTYYRWVRC